MSTNAEIGRNPIELEPAAQPIGALPVADAAQVAAEKQRARGTILDVDADRGAETACHRGRVERLQIAEPGRCEIAGDAPHAEAVGAVWRYLDVDDRIAETEQLGVVCSNRRVLGRFDDAVMIVPQAQLVD